jgi:aerobic carbon-monoxide dehydrogenase medium subunit
MHNPFQIVRPQTVAEASSELGRLGDSACVYAGGSELLLLLRHGLVDYEHLIDIKPIDQLSELKWDGSALHIGANVTHRRLELSPLVREHLPALAQVESQVANVRVRNVGTLGGNLCYSEPHSDPGTMLLVHDAIVALQRDDRTRTLPLDEFLVGSYETALEPAELLAGVEVPALAPGMGVAYERVEKIERPSAGVAVAATLRQGRLSDVRMAVGCVGPRPVRLRELELSLLGLSPQEGGRVIAEARPALRDALEPVDDIHGSIDYKTYIVSVLLARALARAAMTETGE